MEVMKKEFVHKDWEICPICKKQVVTKTQQWVAIIDYIGVNHQKTAIYHRVCVNNIFKGKVKAMKETFQKVGSNLKNMFNQQAVPQNFEFQ